VVEEVGEVKGGGEQSESDIGERKKKGSNGGCEMKRDLE